MSEDGPRFDRRCLPQEVRDRLREDGRSLYGFASGLSGPFTERAVLDRFLEIRSGYEERWHDAVLYHLLRDLIAGSLERGFAVTLQAWSEGLATERSEVGSIIERAFFDETIATYRRSCEDAEVVPWVSVYFPSLPEADSYEPYGAALFGAMLKIYCHARGEKGHTGDLITDCWEQIPLRLQSSPLHLYVSEFCSCFGLPAPGTHLRDGYKLETVVGVGGMGIVYRAVHSDRFRVALKVMRPDCTSRDRFVMEGRRTVRLTDRRFVTVKHTALGNDSELPFFTMDYVEGGKSLTDLIDKPESFDDAELDRLRANLGLRGKGSRRREKDLLLAAVVKRVAEALQELHTRGMVHCDVKAGNVLLSKWHGPLVSDLGLSRRLEGGRTKPEPFSGTAPYSSPEQAEGNPLTPRSDVYQLGAMIYRGITGCGPFRKRTKDEPLDVTLERVRTEPIPSPRQNGSESHRDLEAICLKALNRDPERRYASAQAMAADLDRFIRGKPPRADRTQLAYGAQILLHSVLFWLVVLSVMLASGYRYWSWLDKKEIDECVASTNWYRAKGVISPPPVTLLEKKSWENPDYGHVSFESSSIFFDLSAWRPLPAGASPDGGGRVEPAYYTRVVDLIRLKDDLPEHGKVRFQFRTEGYDVDLHCTTHRYQVRGSRDREFLGGSTKPVLVREVEVDLNDIPVGKRTRIVIQGTIWNGFQPGAEHKQWAAFLAPNNLPYGEIAVRFPPGLKPPHPPRLLVFRRKSAKTEVPLGTQNFYNPPGKPWWVWRPVDIERDHVYQLEWPWSPGS